MNMFTHIMMFGWIPVVFGLFSKLPPRRAVISAFIFAWLFLPMAKYEIPGLPDYTKMSATCWGVFISAAIFDTERLLSFRPRLMDLPMLIWCICPLFSSLSNDLGLYDGISAALNQTMSWGSPYIIGRIYFNDLNSIKEFAIGIFIGCIIYMPLCWYEMRMSPTLHHTFYGFTQHYFLQSYRYGGWRPMVFMSHGLAVGVWMVSGSLIGLWLWISGGFKKIMGISIGFVNWILLLTSMLCRSTGAIGLFILGMGALFYAKRFKSKIIVICLALLPIIYLPVRATGYWDGDNLCHFLYDHFNKQRALSLYTRFDNENSLTEKARLHPVFGWGGWGRARVYDEQGNDVSVTDSLWIISFGNHGVVGLCSLTISILLPIITIMRRYNAAVWFHPKLIPAITLSMLVCLYMIDNLLNSMINPIYMVAAGGIISLEREFLDEKDTVKLINKIPWIRTQYKPRFI
jgi:hypothetical protein